MAYVLIKRQGSNINLAALNSPWVILLIAGVLEFCWAIGLKYSVGFTRLWPSLWTAVTMLLSVWLLSIAMNKIPLSIAYSVWVGIGSVGTVIYGIYFLNEPVNFQKVIFLLLIIIGIAGLKYSS